jgi:hypothetical protein
MAYTGQNPKFNSTVLKDVGVSSIANPASGSHRLINRGGTFQVQDSTGLETAIGAGGTVDKITQTAHAFLVGEVLYYTGTAYARALANAANTSEIVGMVSRVIDANTFEATLEGKVTGLTGLTAGEAYFLSPTVSGGITITEPTVLGQVSLPVGIAISATVIYVRSSRGAVVGSSNARTEIALANNAVSNVQSVAAYQAGELTGWVEIDGSPTDYKFYVAAPFAKNGAATDYNISPQYVGDTPPVGFLLTVTSAGIIQATLPSITGYVSAKINYALNAPAVGATFPLTVDSTAVQFSTLKAKDSSGFVFQNSSATQVGTISNGGAWLLESAAGPTLTVNKTSSGSNSLVFTQNGTNQFRFGYDATAGDSMNGTTADDVIIRNMKTTGSGGISFGGGASNTTFGRMSFTGAWTFGSSSSDVGHTMYGGMTANRTGDGTGYAVAVSSASYAGDMIILNASGRGSSSAYKFLRCDNTSLAAIAFIRGDGVLFASSATVNTTSDVRLKKNIQRLSGSSLEKLAQLAPSTWDWIDDRAGETKGFVAQEVEQVYPEFVCEGEGGFKALGINGTGMIAELVKAIQELSAKVTALELQLN